MDEVAEARRIRGWLEILAGLMLVGLLMVLWDNTPYLAPNGRLSLGSVGIPLPTMMAVYAMWGVFGIPAAVLITLGLSDVLPGASVERLARWRTRIPEQWVVVGGAALGFLIPALIRVLVLQEAPLTDDESAYRFSSQLLASGHLTVPSPPEKLVFDRAFMVNDGTWYSQYFLGWPALMVPFVLLGVPGYANSVYSAITVPILYRLCRRLVGGRWAPVAILLYLTSPMLMVAAATEMSHTSCLFAMLTAGVLLLRTVDAPRDWRGHAGLALAFSVGFFIRPLAALGLGVPLLACWGIRWWREGRNTKSLAAFVVPALVMGGLFLAVNAIQTGHAFKPAYQRTFEYIAENKYRFAHLVGPPKTDVPNLKFDPVSGLRTQAAALLRLNFALSGWPLGMALILLARRRKSVPWVWGSVVSFLFFHSFLSDVGVDDFGPVHFFELAGPMLVLTTMGVASATEWLRDNVRPNRVDLRRAVRIPVLAVGVLTMLALLVFVPARVSTLAAVARSVNEAYQAPLRAGVSNAVVFAYRPAVLYCGSFPARGFVFWRPNPSPALDDDVVWANHTTLDRDRRVVKQVFPGRRGYLMAWTTKCRVVLIDLDTIPEGKVPPGAPRSWRPVLYKE